MHRFLQSNPGLRSRFSREITFPDYSTDDLVEITRKLGAEYEYSLDEDAVEALRQILGRAARGEGFGNARFARTLFEQALNAQALRLAGVQGGELADLERSELMTLRGDDLAAAARALGEDAPDESRAGSGGVGARSARASVQPGRDEERNRSRGSRSNEQQVQGEQDRQRLRSPLRRPGTCA